MFKEQNLAALFKNRTFTQFRRKQKTPGNVQETEFSFDDSKEL